jgi:hypothetical protein
LMRLASPHRLRPQVFSTSRRFDPPRACRPCFMPNPLMGLRPTELCSPRAAVRRLRRRCPPAVWNTPNRTCTRRPGDAPKHTPQHLGCRVHAPCRSTVPSPETDGALTARPKPDTRTDGAAAQRCTEVHLLAVAQPTSQKTKASCSAWATHELAGASTVSPGVFHME